MSICSACSEAKQFYSSGTDLFIRSEALKENVGLASFSLSLSHFQSSVIRTVLFCFNCKLMSHFHFWHCGELFSPGKNWQLAKVQLKTGEKLCENSGAGLNVVNFSHHYPAGK